MIGRSEQRRHLVSGHHDGASVGSDPSEQSSEHVVIRRCDAAIWLIRNQHRRFSRDGRRQFRATQFPAGKGARTSCEQVLDAGDPCGVSCIPSAEPLLEQAQLPAEIMAAPQEVVIRQVKHTAGSQLWE